MARASNKEIVRQMNNILKSIKVSIKEETTRKVIQALVAVMQSEIKLYGEVFIEGLGTFKCTVVQGHDMKMPIQGVKGEFQTVYVEAYEQVSFVPTAKFKDIIKHREIKLPKGKARIKRYSPDEMVDKALMKAQATERRRLLLADMKKNGGK